MPTTNYTPTPNPIVPGTAQAPFAGWNLNPQGSLYGVTYGQNTTALIQRDITAKIVEAIPQQFKLMKLLFNQGVEYTKLKEHTWFEETWNRNSLTATAGVGAGSPQVIPMANTAGVSVTNEVVYPDNTHGIVIALTANVSITVQAMTGAGNLPAVANLDKLIVQDVPIADGMNTFMDYERLNLIERTNYTQRFRRNRRYTREEMQAYKNAGTTDYYERDLALMMRTIYQDAYATYVNGVMGEYTFTIPGGAGVYRAMTSNGIFPQLVSGGAQHATSDPSTVIVDFETLANNTNYKNPDEPRFIIGTNKMISRLNSLFKDPIRYSTDDRTRDLGLDVVKMGNMKFVPVITETFKKESYMFPAAFENRLLVLDLANIKPTCMTGFQPFEMQETKMSIQDGGREDYKEWTIEGMVSCKLANIDGNFWVDGIGF